MGTDPNLTDSITILQETLETFGRDNCHLLDALELAVASRAAARTTSENYTRWFNRAHSLAYNAIRQEAEVSTSQRMDSLYLWCKDRPVAKVAIVLDHTITRLETLKLKTEEVESGEASA
jgi:hypothetical protein